MERVERKEAELWMDRLGVVPREPKKVIAQLSGGNQQKVVVARWLRKRPRLLVLEEPTQGVDAGTVVDIHKLVDEAAAAAAGVLVCSSDARELARLCSSVMVLSRGGLIARLEADQLNVADIERAQLKLAA